MRKYEYIVMLPRRTLDELAHLETVPALWSDKRSPRKEGEIYVCHDYLKRYEREWSKWRDQPIRILEIGLNVGASIKLWLQYFTQAKVVGVDIVDFQFGMPVEADALERFQFVKGDAMDHQFWEKFRREHEPFDIIIDDGAHSSGTIITAFGNLWEKVKPGGYYVVEDLGEVRNPASHTPGYPDQLEWSTAFLANVIMGHSQFVGIDECHVSKELLIIQKQ